MPKSNTNKDLKVKVNIQSLIHPYIFSQYSEDVGMVLCIFTLTFRSLSVFLFGMPSLQRFSFIIIFLTCFCTFFLFSQLCCEVGTVSSTDRVTL